MMHFKLLFNLKSRYIAGILLLIPSYLFFSCGATQLTAPSHIQKIEPTAEPAPPQALPSDTTEGEAMNTEYYLVDQETEEKLFADFAKQIQEIQVKQAQKKEQPIQRGFHAKDHGCFYGKFELNNDRDPRTQFGIFTKDQKSYPIWARFSNGVGWKQADDELDARGFAVKVMGIQGKKYLESERETQDFLMTNSASPVGKNAVEFMKFAHKNVEGVLSGVIFALSHPSTAAPALIFNTSPVDSMVNEQYWSGGAYHLGAHQSIKYTSKPCRGVGRRSPNDDDPDYLQKDLNEAAKKDGLCFSFYVQFQLDPLKQPIENAAKVWQEDDSPLIHVGNFIFPPQDSFQPKVKALCHELSFNPWHSIAAHRPMGHINRARKYVYQSSSQFRKRGVEPKDFLDITSISEVLQYKKSWF